MARKPNDDSGSGKNRGGDDSPTTGRGKNVGNNASPRPARKPTEDSGPRPADD